jgi:menaquinone-specific isochorismate synthase
MESPRGDETGVTLLSRAAPVDAPPLRAVLGDTAAPRTVWDGPGEATVVASGAAAALTAAGPDRFEAIRRGAADLLADRDVERVPEPARPRLFGGFAFHADGGTAPTDEDSPWAGFPGARFFLPRVQLASVAGNAWITVNVVGSAVDPEAVADRLDAERNRLSTLPEPGPVADPPGVERRERTMSLDQWRRGVEAAVDRIEAGELRKVVLAQALRTTLKRPLSLPDSLARLGRTYPDCYRFLLEPALMGETSPGNEEDLPGTDAAVSYAVTPAANGGSFFGATPERLVTLHGRTLETGALAGTTGRGDTPTEDEWLAEELRGSEKDVHEHELVVDSIRDQLIPLASSVSAGERTVRRLATVQHLWTPIRAELAGDEHVLTLVEALHPTPAVGGLPPARALETIRETEPFDRGWYASPVGWFDASGNGSFAVALRSAVTRDRTATLFAGVGVVADSDPDREWDEVQLKYRPILDELEAD